VERVASKSLPQGHAVVSSALNASSVLQSISKETINAKNPPITTKTPKTTAATKRPFVLSLHSYFHQCQTYDNVSIIKHADVLSAISFLLQSEVSLQNNLVDKVAIIASLDF
jgi:hypothetical protein